MGSKGEPANIWQGDQACSTRLKTQVGSVQQNDVTRPETPDRAGKILGSCATGK